MRELTFENNLKKKLGDMNAEEAVPPSFIESGAILQAFFLITLAPSVE